MGCRRLSALVAGLPAGGALHRALDPEGWRWDVGVALQALLVEKVDALFRLTMSVALPESKRHMVPEPLRIPRPWDDPDRGHHLRKPEELAEAIAEFRKGTADRHPGR